MTETKNFKSFVQGPSVRKTFQLLSYTRGIEKTLTLYPKFIQHANKTLKDIFLKYISKHS